jgi:hypothetical protein
VNTLKPMPGTGKKRPQAEGEPSTLGALQWGLAEGEPATPGLFRGLFYSWPVAPQQSRLRFKQPPNLAFFPFGYALSEVNVF